MKNENENESKTLLYARMTVWLTAAILALLCVVSLWLAPKLIHTIDHAETSLSRLDTLVDSADTALSSATEAANNANKLLLDNEEAVGEAMAKFNSVDFEALNRAINDLATVVEPLARVSSLFGTGNK